MVLQGWTLAYVLQVVAANNAKVEEYVSMARASAATTVMNSTDVSAVWTKIAATAAVQQKELAAAVSSMAIEVAVELQKNETYEVPDDLPALQDLETVSSCTSPVSQHNKPDLPNALV